MLPDFQDCPLCGSSASFHAESRWGRYFHCPECDLVSQWREQWPDAGTERSHYDTHENSPDDPGYRGFLARLARPLFDHLEAGATGLDYGCGPGPTLAVMAAEAGYRMANYDPLFARDEAVLQRQYDFITCTEAAEHFHDPAAEFSRMAGLLKPGGWLGLMTELHDEVEDFSGWWYHRDPTHVVFYSTMTLRWLAACHGWEIVSREGAVTLLRQQ